jgi:uncharacterized protein (DUF1697 family)
MNQYIALLRGINVGGHKLVPMVELRTVCSELGWEDVQTYIQSGNVVFRADAATADLEADLEEAIRDRFGFRAPVLVRKAEAWSAYLDGNPYREAAASEPNLVMLALARTAPGPAVLAALLERASAGERVAMVGDGFWVHYAGGAGPSRLSPGLLDRVVGSPVTTRNWRTVVKLHELARSG